MDAGIIERRRRRQRHSREAGRFRMLTDCCCRGWMAFNASVLVKLMAGLFAVIWTGTAGMRSIDPSFEPTSDNITAIAGQSAVLPCTVNHLGKYKVVWLDQNTYPLTFDDRRVIDDQRFSVVRPYIKDWNLVIREVRQTDTGQYRCTVNTDPVMSKTINLDVKVSPRFVDQVSTQTLVAREGDTVVLVCNVTGTPEPEVTWQRRVVTGGKVSYAVEGLETVGPQLALVNVTRRWSDLYFVYECHANNGVPPAVSKQIRLSIQYPPELTVNYTPSTRLRRGQKVTLECTVTALPMGNVYWERRQPPYVTLSDRHATEFIKKSDHTVLLRAVIRELTSQDFGEYACVAVSPVKSFQRVEESITILEDVDSQPYHVATASKREHVLNDITPTRSSMVAPEVKRERSSPSSRLLTAPSDSSSTDRQSASSSRSALLILTWSIAHYANRL